MGLSGPLLPLLNHIAQLGDSEARPDEEKPFNYEGKVANVVRDSGEEGLNGLQEQGPRAIDHHGQENTRQRRHADKKQNSAYRPQRLSHLLSP